MPSRKAGTRIPEDLWRVDSDDYSPNKFYTASTDKRGHGSVVHIKLPDYVYSQLEGMVQRGDIPEYKTVQDFIRDAIAHRIHWLLYNHELRGLERLAAMIRVAEKAAKLVQEAEESEKVLERISKLVSEGYKDQAKEILLQFLEYCPDSKRDKALQLAQTYWPGGFGNLVM